MQPLPFIHICLAADEIPIGVQRVIQETCPNDRATGYHEGDVRGAVSI